MKKAKEKIDFDISQLSTSFPYLGKLRFPMLGQIVLVTSINREGIPNVAPKSWISIFSSNPPIVGFGCNTNHTTAKNILTTGEFVINIPGEEIVQNAWKIIELDKDDPKNIEKAGLTPAKSTKISTPRIAECKAQLECSLDWTKKYKEEIVIFGKVLLAAIDKAAVEKDVDERYKYFKLLAYLDEKTYGVINAAKKV
jgi:flavin reductase (DIM6/NTAB) family NADH-FMN oxidoreductase RutF